MDLKEGARAVLDELRRQREEGVEAVYLEEETLAGLQFALGSSEGDETVAVIPEAKPEPQPRPKPIASAKAPTPSSPATALPAPPVVNLPEGDKETRRNWLRDLVLACPTCNENLNANAKVVFGVGAVDAEIFFCGEAPGADEEMAGEPFVGPAGQLLDKVVGAMGLTREKVYIGNVMNWRPQHEQAFGNRPPSDEEMEFCMPYLRAQVKVVEPKVIVALGRTATNGLLQPDSNLKMGDLRGRWWEFEKIPVMVTYHPSYLLHNPSKVAKRRVWEDLLLVMERLEMPISEKQRGFFL